MTHHCPRSNWTGPESELRRGICQKCAGTTLYEDCRVRPTAITFTDGEGRFHVLRVDDESNATPDDLARAGYFRGTRELPELHALRALEQHLRSLLRVELAAPKSNADGSLQTSLNLLKAIDEARK